MQRRRGSSVTWVLFALVLVLVIAASWRHASKPSAAVDLDAALKQAVDSKRPVLLDFTASWCPPCRQMEQQTWPDPAVKKALESFVFVKVDVDANPALADRFKVTGVPTLLILGTDGEIRSSSTGFASPDQLLPWLARYSTPQ